MNILILGGTGAMGVHLVELLSKRDVEVVVTSRSYRESIGNVKYIQGNAKDVDFIDSLLKREWDVIVDFMVYTTKMFELRVNLLLEATSQYIFISSSRVYADSKRPITESSSRLLDVTNDDEYLLTDEYALTKARQENILKNASFNNWTIIRPYITYSEIRLQLGVLEKESWLYRAIHGRTIVFSKDIYNKLTTLTYGLDVSKAINNLVGLPEANGEIFHITVNECMSWKKILDLYISVIEDKYGFRPMVLLQDMNEFLSHHHGKDQVLKDRVYNRVFDSSKIANFIEIDSFTTMEEGLIKCLSEFLENPKFKGINWMAEAIKDKQTKEYTPLREIKGIKQKIKYLLFRYFK